MPIINIYQAFQAPFSPLLDEIDKTFSTIRSYLQPTFPSYLIP